MRTDMSDWHEVERWTDLLRDKRDDEQLSFWNGVEEPTNVQFLPRPDGIKDLSAYMPGRWSQPAKYVRLVPVEPTIHTCVMPGENHGSR
jgi:hypothetical protein